MNNNIKNGKTSKLPAITIALALALLICCDGGNPVDSDKLRRNNHVVCAQTVELASPVVVDTHLKKVCGNDEVDYIYSDYSPLDVRNGATLTIDPGVIIRFAGADGWGGLRVTDSAAVKAVGNAKSRIRFVGSQHLSVGSWDMIHLDGVKTDNKFEYCDFINGGRSSAEVNSPSVLQINGSKVSIKNCVISGSNFHGIGLWHDFELAAFDNNTIENCAQEPIIVRNAQLRLEALNTTSDLKNNAKPYIRVQLPQTVTAKSTLNETSVPYYFEGRITDLFADLEFNAGVTVYMPPYGAEKNCPNLSSGEAANTGRFLFNGEPDNPVTFTRPSDADYRWVGIEFTSAANHQIINTVFEYGGGGGAVYGPLSFVSNASAVLDNVHIRDSDSYGLYSDTVQSVNVLYCDVIFDNNRSGNFRWGGNVLPKMPNELANDRCRLATVVVTVDSGQGKEYGQPDPDEFKYTSSDTTVIFTGKLVRESGEGMGDYPIMIGTLSADDNYIIEFVGADFVIGRPSVVPPSVLPDSIKEIIGGTIPIYSGTNPPDIKGSYLVSPQIVIGSNLFEDIRLGATLEDIHISFTDDGRNGILSYSEDSQTSQISSDSVFVVGTGNNFTAYFVSTGVTDGVENKMAVIISGTMTEQGIYNFHYALIMLDKGVDYYNMVVPVGAYRITYDEDGLAEKR